MKIRGHWFIVAWEGLDVDDAGRQLVPGSLAGLTYGREIHPPVARVLDVGPNVTGLQPGDRIVATKDMGALVPMGDLLVQAIATHVLDPRTDKPTPTDEVAAVLRDDGWPRAHGRRIIGIPVDPPRRADALIDCDERIDGTERLQVISIGPDARAEFVVGDIVIVPRGSGRRVEWSDDGTTYVSVVDESVLGVQGECAACEAPIPRRRAPQRYEAAA